MNEGLLDAKGDLDMYGDIAVVYDGNRDDILKMAESVAKGVVDAGGKADLFTAEEFDTYKAVWYSGIALGCQMIEKGEALNTRFGRLYNALKPKLQGKRIGLFTNLDGDPNWIVHWERDIRGAGIILESESVVADGEVDEKILSECERLGGDLV